ncbi:MAG TPA: hypothetical protein VEV83_08205 [Parafilimonas sp.]|nr:hypothetical protein [Parafilimonas sp.]
MKKWLTPLCLFLFFSASAQLTTDDVNLIQSMYGKDKRDLMQEYLTFKDDAQATAFWKMYDSYEAERKKLGQDFIKILEDYATNYETLTDATADKLVTRMTANNIAFENLYSKTYKQMKPVVGALKASQFLQLEAYLRSVIKTAVLDEIPFIGQIDRSHLPAPTKQQ